MRKLSLLFFLLVFSYHRAYEQGQGYTRVFATGKTCYANGSVQAGFVNQSSSPTLPLLNGSTFPQSGVTNFDSAGNFSFYLADNQQIFPTPSQWTITACAKSGGQPACGTAQLTITGSQQDITSTVTGFQCPNSGGGGTIPGQSNDVFFNQSGGLSVDHGIFTYIPNTRMLSTQGFQGVQYVGPNLSRGGVDIGDEINKAYASLPSTGGLIYISPNTSGACYNYTTPIVLNVAGKLANIVGQGTAGGGVTQVGQGSVCLNYLPATGTAMTLDYVGNYSANTMNAHGLSNVFLINNGCVASGGCPANAASVGLDNGNTNAGMSGATLQNVTITGFGTGWRNVSHVAGGESQSIEMLWVNALFFKNTTAIVIENPTGINFIKGSFFSNGKVIVGNDANAWPEIKLFGTTFAGNTTTPIIDFTATTAAAAHLYTFGVHWETSTPDMNLIAGYIELNSNGDLFETNNATGSGCTDLIDAKLSSNIQINGANINAAVASGGCPMIVNAETTSVIGQVQGFVRGFTAVAGGPGAANILSNTFNTSGALQLPGSGFPGGLAVGNSGGSGIRFPLTFRGPANGGLWLQLGDNTTGVKSVIGSNSSTGGPASAYNAVPTGVGTWVALDATRPTMFFTADSTNGWSWWEQPAGTCPTSGTNTFATCFGTSPVANVSPSGFLTANRLTLPGATSLISLNGSFGTLGQVLTSQGGVNTPTWTTLPNISGTSTVGKGVCWKTSGGFGSCSTAIDATGSCTCN